MTSETESRRTVFVTGGSYGIGAAIARLFAREGYDVAVSARSRENLERVVLEISAAGAHAIPIALDLRSESGITAAMAELFDACGHVDVLVNNAALTTRGPAIGISRGDWGDVIGSNLTGTFFLTQEFGRRLIIAGRGGSVINITSTHGIVGTPDRLAYGVSKAALNHLTKMLAIEWADHGIRVNAVAPGRVLTEFSGPGEDRGGSEVHRSDAETNSASSDGRNR